MDSLLQTHAQASADDLSALAWVHEELRKSLDAAHKALRRCLKDVTQGHSDMDALDPAILRTARQQIHQGVGALELAGLSAGATLLRASEAVVNKFVARPQAISAGAVEDIEQASFALLDYIARKLAGKTIAATELFPQYEALMARSGQGLPRPTDLWAQDWPSLSLEAPLAAPPGVSPRAADAATVEDFEMGLLGLLRRQQPQDALDLAALCAGLAAQAETRNAPREAATWMLASGFLEGLAGHHVPLDVHAKRVLSQLLSQLRVLVKGRATPSDRLANELLFFCAQAQDVSGVEQSVLARVRRTFGLERHQAVNLDTSVLGRYDPAWVAQAAKRVAAAKDGWSAVAGGEMLRLSGLNEQFALVADSLHRLFPQGDVLAHALTDAVSATAQSAQVPAPSLAMEVATSLLYIDACIEDCDFDHPEQAARLQRMAERIVQVGQGQPAQPLEGWMEDLYRRVSDRQTIGSVVHELHLSLSDCEKHIDQYFREPTERAPLVQVPATLQSMRGVLAVLGLDQAAHAVVRMRQDIEHLLQPDADLDQAAEQGVFDRIATNLGALGFLIDMMGVQPSLAKTLFAWDDDKGILNPLMGREKKTPLSTDDPVEAVAQHVQEVQRVEAQTAAEEVAEALVRQDVSLSEVSDQLHKLAETPHVSEQTGLADTVALAKAVLASAQASQDDQLLEAAREHVSQVVSDLAQTIAKEGEPELEPEPFPEQAPLAPVTAAPQAATGLEDDDEMRQVFLEEAAEVIDDAQAALKRLFAHPDEVMDQTAVRRAFHTLKGSSRMVGLNAFGEAAWACEQLYNAQLATQQAAPAELLSLSDELLRHFADWRDAIAAGRDAGWSAEPVARVADAMRLDGQRLPLAGAESTVAFVKALVNPDEPDSEPMPLSADMATRGVDLSLEGSARDEAAVLPTEGQWERTDRVSRDASDEPETVPQALMIDPVADHELIVLDLDGAAAASGEPEADAPVVIDAPVPLSPPPKLWSTSELGALDEASLEPLSVTFRDPSLFSSLDSEGATQAGDLVDVSEVDLPLDMDVAALEGEPDAASADLAPESEPAPQPVAEEEQVKVIGDLRIGIPLFNIYLNEADEQSRRLSQVMGEWVLDPDAPTPEEAVALSHSLAGNSATVGYQDLSRLARSLEHALERAQSRPRVSGDALVLFHDASEEVRRLLHQFAAGFLKAASPDLLQQLDAYEPPPLELASSDLVAADEAGDTLNDAPATEATASHLHLVPSMPEDADEAPASLTQPAFAASLPMSLGVPEFKELSPLPEVHETLAPAASAAGPSSWTHEADIDVKDHVDADLFPIFEEEALELLPQLGNQIRQWVELPDNPAAAAACMRTLHTFKGGARLAGAMRLGELAHQLESSIEHLLAEGAPSQAQVAPLEARVDRILEVFEALRNQDAKAYESQTAQVVEAAHAEHAEHVEPPSERGGDVSGDAPLSLALEDEPTMILPRGPAVVPLDQPLVLAEDEPTVAWPAPVPDEGLAEAPHRAADLDLPLMTEEVTATEQGPAQTAEGSEVSAAVAPEAEAPRSARVLHLGRTAEAVLKPIDWSTLTRPVRSEPVAQEKDALPSVAMAAVRVRPQLLDRLVNHAGEVSITRTRLHAQVGHIRGSLNDLTDNLERLRQQLRDIELQAETQLSTRMEAARAARQDFDPLEFDRYTRFQELTRMMAESVNDVATVQRTLQRSLETAEDQLAAQARLTRDLQDDLLRTRMVEFEGLSDRLYRVVRQAAKETGKQVRLDIIGGAIEIDRGVLDRMTGSFEHLLRNCVTHGIELPEVRTAAGKDATGQITVALRQEGNEVSIEVRDDGAGLDLQRIRDRAQAMGLLSPEAQPSEAELSQLIFTSGFSTADAVTELAGRGIGMDVVRADVNAMGGRIETASTAGQGTGFTLVLPLTTAVTKVVMLRCGHITVAVPTHLIEMVRRARPAEVEAAYRSGQYAFADLNLPFYWLGALLEHTPRGLEGGRSIPVVVVRSAQQRVALHVDEVLGNQEVVVKNLGPQLARLPGLAGMTLLASGAVSLIYNPVALATVYGDRAREGMLGSLSGLAADASWLGVDTGIKAGSTLDPEEQARPLVLVVDDSLTVRRVTQRLLVREGYRVKLAKDGLEALEMLAQERPEVVLSDIEMPRMDGFDLVRNIRADQKLAGLPIIMITSRIAQKHRDYAQELGVDHYLGKPYGEEELLALVARYAAQQAEST